MIKQECKSFDSCSATLCPLDSNPKHLWCCDTEVCRLRTGIPDWVKTQKKIAKYNNAPDQGFTIKMLEAIPEGKFISVGITTKTGYDRKKEIEWLCDLQNITGNFQSVQDSANAISNNTILTTNVAEKES